MSYFHWLKILSGLAPYANPEALRQAQQLGGYVAALEAGCWAFEAHAGRLTITLHTPTHNTLWAWDTQNRLMVAYLAA